MMNSSFNDQTMDDKSLKQEKLDGEIGQLAKQIINENKIMMTLLKKTAVAQNHAAPAKEIPAIEPLSEDSTSVYGQFGWTEISTVCFPYLMRSGEKYVAVRMLKTKLFPKYPSKEIALCIDVEQIKLTKVEAQLLNEINTQHCDNLFGTTNFLEGHDIIRLEDAIEINEFFEFCYNKLRERSTDADKRCGFVRVVPGLFLPYVRWKSKRYVPLFYLSGELEYLEQMSEELRGWELTYLKLLCKVHDTFKSISGRKSIRVVDLDIVKQCFYSGPSFDDMWPPNNRIETLLEHSTSENQTENTKKRKDIAGNKSEAKKLATQSQTTVAQACQNILNKSVSDHFLLANSRPRFKIIQKLSPRDGPYTIHHKNLGPSTQSGGRPTSEALINGNTQAVFTNITNRRKKTNKDQLLSPPSRMHDLPPVSNSSNIKRRDIRQIQDFYVQDYRTAYTLAKYEIHGVTLKHSINFAPNDPFVLVTVVEVAKVLLKIKCEDLEAVLDYLQFVVFRPNQAHIKLLGLVGLDAKKGLLSGLDVKLHFDKFRSHCDLSSRKIDGK